jgi:hypothetical protein
VANLWTLEGDRGEGLTLELEDGTEQFLCFECVEALPDSPTSDDVDRLESATDPGAHPQKDPDETDRHDGPAARSNVSSAFPAGLTLGAILGLTVGTVVGELRAGAWAGAAIGMLVGLAWPWARRLV